MNEQKDKLDNMLYDLYGNDIAPNDVNIRLLNQIKCKEAMDERGAHIWWLPALMSTLLAVFVLAVSFIIYCVINLAGADSLMPHLLRFVTGGFLKIELVIAACQVAVSWLFTIISLWKFNLYQSARL